MPWQSCPESLRVIRECALFAATALLAACASSPPAALPLPSAQGAVGASLIQPASGTPRMDLARNRRFIHPNLETSTLPDYPADLLASGLAPVVVCVDAVIDVAGLVSAARVRRDDDCAPPVDLDTAAFEASALQAVRSWNYAPALLCEAPPDFDGDDACQAADAVETPTAVRLSYAFRFSQQAGTPQVERVGGR